MENMLVIQGIGLREILGSSRHDCMKEPLKGWDIESMSNLKLEMDNVSGFALESTMS